MLWSCWRTSRTYLQDVLFSLSCRMQDRSILERWPAVCVGCSTLLPTPKMNLNIYSSTTSSSALSNMWWEDVSLDYMSIIGHACCLTVLTHQGSTQMQPLHDAFSKNTLREHSHQAYWVVNLNFESLTAVCSIKSERVIWTYYRKQPQVCGIYWRY